MLKSDEKTRFRLAHCLTRFFCGHIQHPADLYTIHTLVEKSMRRLVVKWGLRKVVTEEQIQNSALDFIEELTISPGKSRYCGCLFAEIRLKEKASLRFIHYYTQKRLFTILKSNADSLSSEYMRFDANVKRNLRQLVLAKAIFFRSPDRYAVDNPEILPDIRKYQLEPLVLARLPFKRVWRNNRIVSRNLRPSLEMLLAHPPHNNFRFKKRLISSTLFCLSDELIQRQISLIHSDINANHEFSLSVEVAEVLTFLKKSFKTIFPGKDFYLTTMLLFAHFYCDYPEYFSNLKLFPGHYEVLHAKKGKVDRLFSFCRLIVRDNSLSDAELGRTTVFNRLQKLKEMLRSILNDCSMACRRKIILKLVYYLIGVYSKIGCKNEKL